ncbi:MAG: RDD family protein [Saprospiraceae bacterium]
MKTILINTTQNVAISCELATLSDRIFAWLIDMIVFSFTYWIMAMLVTRLFSFEMADGEWGWAVAIIIAPFFLYMAYNMIMEYSNAGQTLGKQAMNIRVVRLDGKEVEWGDTALRAFLQLLDTLFSFGVIAVMLVRVSAFGQRLGDMAAATTVIKVVNTRYAFRLSDISAIASINNYQPRFPQVKQLSEEDMLIIKKVIARVESHTSIATKELLSDLAFKMCELLDIPKNSMDSLQLLKTLLKDYIVLTR